GQVVPGGGEVGEPRAAIREGIVAERGGAGVMAPVDAAGDVDPPVQRRGGELLHGLGKRCGGGPAAVGGDERRAGGEQERQRGRAEPRLQPRLALTVQRSTSPRGAAAPRGRRARR